MRKSGNTPDAGGTEPENRPTTNRSGFRGFLSPSLPCLLYVCFIAVRPVNSDSEPSEAVTLGRVCAHNDGAGLLSAELTFRYPPFETVLIDPSTVEAKGLLLRVEWHVRDQSPVRVLYSHLEAALQLETDPTQDPKVIRRVKDYGRNLAASNVYNDVDAFEETVTLSLAQPLCIARLTGKAVAEAKLDKKSVGPESRVTFFVRKMSVGTPQESASLSRYFGGWYRRLYELESFLRTYLDYLAGASSVATHTGETRDRGTDKPEADAGLVEKELSGNLKSLLKEYAAAQHGLQAAGDSETEDRELVFDFLDDRAREVTAVPTGPEKFERIRRVASEAGKLMVTGLQDATACPLVISVLPAMDRQLRLQTKLSDALRSTQTCRSVLLRVLGARSREELVEAVFNLGASWSMLTQPLDQLQEALEEGIGFAADPLSNGTAPPESFAASLKPPLDCLIAGLCPVDYTESQRQLSVEGVRSRLMPLWLYLGTTVFGKIGAEQAALLSAVEHQDLGKRTGTEPRPKVDSSFSPEPNPQSGRNVPIPVTAQMMVKDSTQLATEKKDQPAPILACSFSGGLQEWREWYSAGTPPGEHSCKSVDLEGDWVLELRREHSNLTIASVGVDRDVDLMKTDLEGACLQLEFRVEKQTHLGGSSFGGGFPLNVELTYSTADKDMCVWRFGFCGRGNPGEPQRALKVDSKKWILWKSSSLTGILPDLKRLKRVRVYGSGWDYLVWIKALRITR
ncbi:MAG: hypothetical protein HY318_13045 [Armatimonadetes bacterium]|nr:hypothetical protein [Armatimonadota bacterium]